VIAIPEARAQNARATNVRWLTPRAFRRWVDIGLRGHTASGLPSPGWRGRLEDRNTSFANVLMSSGMRLTEAASLLAFEMPRTELGGGRYYIEADVHGRAQLLGVEVGFDGRPALEALVPSHEHTVLHEGRGQFTVSLLGVQVIEACGQCTDGQLVGSLARHVDSSLVGRGRRRPAPPTSCCSPAAGHCHFFQKPSRW
jgi:hypothetical protein